MIQPDHPTLSIVQQCRLASIAVRRFIMCRVARARRTSD